MKLSPAASRLIPPTSGRVKKFTLKGLRQRTLVIIIAQQNETVETNETNATENFRLIYFTNPFFVAILSLQGEKTMNLADLVQQFSTEDKARELLEKTLWPDGPICPHCGLIGEVYRLKAKPGSKRPVRPGVWKCKGCRKQFTVKIGTIFEDSHIPLHKWLLAINLLCASKKGMSSHQIHRQLGITYKSAWFMTHRIRYAMQQEPFQKLLKGTGEIDETYVGGKLRVGPHAHKPGERPQDWKRAIDNKALVVALVERGGKVRSMHIANVTAANLKEVIRQNVDPAARVMTDEAHCTVSSAKNSVGTAPSTTAIRNMRG